LEPKKKDRKPIQQGAPTSSNTDATPSSGKLTFHRDIKPLMETKCAGCHAAGGLSAVELTEYAQVKKMSAQIKSTLTNRRMPPWIADSGHQTYKDDLSLADSEQTSLIQWIDAGTPEGDKSTYVAPKKKEGFKPDVTYEIFTDDGAYLPRQESADDYRCFIVPFDDKLVSAGYVTGFTATPGNSKLVHHLVAYLVDAAVIPYLNELDTQEPGRGYQCYGGATPDRLADATVQQALEAKFPGSVQALKDSNYWLAHWAPGMEDGYVFPAGTGIKLPPGGAFVVQMHYYSKDAKGESDRDTSFGLKTTKTVAKPAFYYPLTNQAWLQGKATGSMVIKAKSNGSFATEKTLEAISAYGKRVLDITTPIKSLEAHSANLHMHAIGKSGVITQGRSDDKEPEILLKVSKWDLHWQRDFQFEPKIVPLAELAQWTRKITCTYANETDSDVYGGFGSNDEMCFDFGYFAFDLGN
jgi:hypothetical protein